MKNKKKLRTGSASATKKPWPLLSRVAFLDKVEFERSTISNVSTPCASEFHESLTENDADNFEGEQITSEENSSKASPSLIETSVNTSIGKRSRSNTDKLAMVLSKRSKERDAILQTIQTQNELILNMDQNQDDIDLFFKSIAKSVKKLPKKGVAEAKLKILSLVSDLENKYAEPTVSNQEQSTSFVETSKSTPDLKQKLFTPYDMENHPQESAQFFQYNHDDNYIFLQ